MIKTFGMRFDAALPDGSAICLHGNLSGGKTEIRTSVLAFAELLRQSAMAGEIADALGQPHMDIPNYYFPPTTKPIKRKYTKTVEKN